MNYESTHTVEFCTLTLELRRVMIAIGNNKSTFVTKLYNLVKMSKWTVSDGIHSEILFQQNLHSGIQIIIKFTTHALS